MVGLEGMKCDRAAVRWTFRSWKVSQTVIFDGSLFGEDLQINWSLLNLLVDVKPAFSFHTHKF